MTMGGKPVARRGDGRAWWQEPWVGLALGVFVLQIGLLWIVTPNPDPPRVPAPPARQRIVGESGSESSRSSLDAWKWLFTPALLLRPSDEDFSGPAWMRGTAVRIEVEAFDVPERPLPWFRDRPSVVMAAPSRRPAPGPALGWGVPSDSVALPPVPGVPLAGGPRVRVVAGLAGRGWATGAAPALEDPGVGPARPVVIRVRVAADGELASPPVLWEGGDVAAADEAALKAARHLRFNPTKGEEGEGWGLVAFEWGSGAGGTNGGTAVGVDRSGAAGVRGEP